MADEPRYAIGDLAELGGVSRRTVRYYVQEGLIPAPLGVGRGNHYGPAHLQRLLRVKALQESGRTLDEIRRAFDDGEARVPHGAVSEAPPVPRSVWRRITLSPGVELHISSDVRLPAAGKLHELASWCHINLPATPAPPAPPATASGRGVRTGPDNEEENDA
jgi:DNA-binding transcriptional MerR regulator